MKQMITILILGSSLFAGSIYDAVEELPFDAAGRFKTEFGLDSIFRDREIKTVIEVGCWIGCATRYFAYNVGENGVVYAVDHWEGTPNYRPETHDPRRKELYHLFLSNIKQMNLQDRVIPVRMDSTEAAKALTVTADLIYIDASRKADQVYERIMEWLPHLNENGILCGAEYREPGVREGVRRAAEELNMHVKTDRRGLLWILQ